MRPHRTGSVSINAAFLKEIKEDHRDLSDLIDRLKTSLQPVSFHAGYRELAGILRSLQDRLGMHFTLEEAYGYFNDAVSVAPHLSRRAEELRSQHAVLFGQMQKLVEYVERSLYHESNARSIDSQRLLIHEFLVLFERHEHEENELILDAYEQDLGSGD